MRVSPLLFALGALCALAAAPPPALAQRPEGPPEPRCGVQKDEFHVDLRFGYDGTGRVCKYPGEFSGDTNFIANGRQSFYGLGDIFIESSDAAGNVFQPSRLWGLFEVGGRQTIGPGQTVDLFLRHQSAHNVDNLSGPHDMWESVGPRWRITRPEYDLWLSAAYYARRIEIDYAQDVEAHATVHRGNLFGRPIAIDGDVRGIATHGAGRSGFVDFSVEPSIAVNQHVWIYAQTGNVHDVDRPNGRTEVPWIVGARAAL